MLGDIFRFIRDWIEFNPYAVSALAVWVLSIAIAYCLIMLQNSVERKYTDRTAVWLRRGSRILLVSSTAFVAVSMMPEWVMQSMESQFHVFARHAGFEPDYPTRWKAQDLGGRAAVEIDASRIRIKVASTESGPVARFNEAELQKRQGIYVGTAKTSRPCGAGKSSAGQGAALCTEEAPIEVTLVTRSRIEGRLGAFESASRGACRNCPPKAPASWHEFVWTPE